MLFTVLSCFSNKTIHYKTTIKKYLLKTETFFTFYQTYQQSTIFVRKICAKPMIFVSCSVTFVLVFFKGMCQCDMCDKNLSKLIRIIYKSAVNKKKHWGLPVGFCQNKSSINFLFQSVLYIKLASEDQKHHKCINVVQTTPYSSVQNRQPIHEQINQIQWIRSQN